jgi:hypothetical protein
MKNIEQEFELNEVVTAKTEPGQLLKIRRYVDRIYYCRLLDKPESPDSVYFGRELKKQAT